VFVEAIIAAAIVAMALGGTLTVIADNAARDRAAEARRGALLLAQSMLADVGAEIPLEPGQEAGVSGDLIWRVAISPYGFGGGAANNPVGELLAVAVQVGPRAGGPALVTLRTLRLQRPS
jgi:Tfp pilus assembly protein PilV